MEDFGLDLAVLGNGRTAASIDPLARIVWWCYPRFDGDPVFSRLLVGDEDKGYCDVVLDNLAQYASEYERNTAVVSTTLTDAQGASVKITDFAPRFRNFGRLAAIASHLGLADRASHWSEAADTSHARVISEAWNEKRGSFTAAFGSEHLDASMLLLPEIGMIEPDDPRLFKQSQPPSGNFFAANM
jgi:GH15 family glucan-1,4-alpha-glucosidase